QENVVVVFGKNVTVHCVQKVCSLCSNLENVKCDLCEGANFTAAPKECKLTSCPDDKWRLPNDELYTGKIECKKNTKPNTGRKAAWYTQEGRQITQASCAKPVNCWAYGNISHGCPPQHHCDGFNYDSDRKNLSCPNGQLTWYHTPTSTVSIGNVTCSSLTGRYTDDTNKSIEEHAYVEILQGFVLRQPLLYQPDLLSLWARPLALQWAELSSRSFSLSSSSLLLDVFIRREKKIELRRTKR
ncbi:hypothetical protein PMAYCL1PPCAC_07646, partial [Pristionchus mayeri]